MIETAKINLKHLMILQQAGDILYSYPLLPERMASDVPESLIKAQAAYIEAKKRLDEEIARVQSSLS